MSHVQALTLSRTLRQAEPSAPTEDRVGRSADLHATVPELLSRLLAAADRDDWLNAFLLCAGLVQVVEDRLEGISWRPRRLLDHLARGDRGLAARIALGSARRCMEASARLALAAPSRHRLCLWRDQLSALTDGLADLVVASDERVPKSRADILRRDLHDADGWFRRHPSEGRLLNGAILRHPSCFGSFDQHPDDVAELSRRFMARHPDRDRALLVVGVRTSGSYLAPLAGAALRQLGYRDVVTGTARPNAALMFGRSDQVRRVRADGMVLLLDDPPITGGSLAAVARRAEQEGFPASAVVPLLATFDNAGPVPPLLRGYPCVVLPGGAWRVRDRLRPDALMQTLSGLLPPGERLAAIEVGEQGPLSRWTHLAVPVTARCEGRRHGSRTIALTAQWSGIGYFGARALTLGNALGDLVPEIYGFADGVLLRERMPGEDAAAGLQSGRTAVVGADDIARYVAVRQRRLAVPADRSLQLAGRQPAWEVAARVLAPIFGRLGMALRPPLLDPLTRSLLIAGQPCVIDGRTTPDRWVADGLGHWVKTDFAEGAFSHLDLASYDAAFDLAGAAVPPGGEDELLAAFRELTGDRVPPARWCLLKLVHAWNSERLAGSGLLPAESAARARRAREHALRRFLAESFLEGLDTDPTGAWCVFDVDGVLETDVLGVPASSPRGLLALRALRAHGYRVLLATGRSLQEVRDRCAAYRLSGGVAEYGCVSYDAVTSQAAVHVPSDGHSAAVSGLVQRLSAMPNVQIDPLFQWSVRASIGAGAHRTGLSAQTLAALVADRAVTSRFDIVPGDAQTDFVPRGADKARGVKGLLGRLGDCGAAPALAVGDGVADLPVLRWAKLAAAPGNAQPAVRASGVPVLRRAYQAGLAQAVGRLIGHRPGGCPVCEPPRQDLETRALLALLAVPEAGRAGAPLRIARLARETSRLRSRAGAMAEQSSGRGGTPW